MRNILRLTALAAVVTIIAAACGDNGGTGSTPTGGGTSAAPSGPVTKVALLYDLGGRGDKSFNDSAAAGLDQAKQDFNLDAKELQPNAGGTNRDELINLAISGGYDHIIGVGFLYAPNIGAAAAANPEVQFGDVDGFVDKTTCDTCQDQTPDGNLTSLLFAENEGAYLVGAAAALASKSHHIGFIGGVNTELIQKFQAGFDAGAQKIDASIVIDHKYITEPPDFSGFNDPAKGQVIAQGMYQAGADVVYHAAGGSGAGLFAAVADFAETSGQTVWAIGTDSDQYQSAPADEQQYILTSNLKNVNVAVYNTIQAFVEGNFQGGVQTFDLKAGGVGYSKSNPAIEPYTAQLDDLAQQIVDGTITVPTTLSS
jgi:basic membrane protein A and related proteins